MPAVDAISRIVRRRKTNRRRKNWRWLFLCLIIPLFFFGRVPAKALKENAEVLSLFRDGKFLVLLQNNAEIRSSGGFIGSFAVVEIKNFEVRDIKFNTNIYTLDRDFSKDNFSSAPSAVAKMLKGETWALRDANYLASFPQAANDILFFYEKESGERVDGIIALNAQVMTDLLKLIGPIKLAQYDNDTVISADNFYQETQYQVEKRYYQNPENWAINEPKSILKDLYPLILSAAVKNKIALFILLKRELSAKEIIFYFKNPQKQFIAESQNWAGKILSDEETQGLFEDSAPVDYLYLSSNSYSGNKSSLSVKEEIVYELSEANIDGKKMLQADLKISRIHTGSDDWPDGINTNWLRIFVSKEARLTAARLNGREILSEVTIGSGAGRTFFGAEVVTAPKQANILHLSYLLPFNDAYNLLVQKQPGVVGDKLTVIYEDKILFNGVLDTDKKISLK